MTGKSEQTGQFKFKSQFTGDFVQAHQYIAEIVVDRKARKEKIELPYKYWTSIPKWKTEFKTQVQQAGKLLKKFSAKAIINALNANLWCYSLMSPKLKISIEAEQKKLDAQVISEKEIVLENEFVFKKKNKKQGLLGKLNERNEEDT